MPFTLVPFTGDQMSAWDAFITSSRNGTIFHTRRFLSYHPETRFQDASLLILDGEKIVAVLPAAVQQDGNKKILASHPGASYGGLVVGHECTVKETGEMLDMIIAHAKKEHYAGIFFLRLPPASLQKQYSEDTQYWLYQKGFSLTRCEMDGAIDLSALGKDMVVDTLTGKCRNMVRQAERANIEVTVSEDFASYWPILEGVLQGRHGTKPTHTVEEIQKLHTLLPDGFRLLAAHKAKKMVGGIVLVTIHEQALYTLYMAQEYKSQEHHPMHLLLAAAMRLAIREKKRVLHLGVSTEDGGKKLNSGLMFFKESFGCRPVRRETWELTIDN